MSETTPSSLPPIPPPSRPPGPPSGPPNFWGMFGLGIVLLIGSCVMCGIFQDPSPFGIGFVAAVVSLFFRSYRGIFIGFISAIGVALLICAIICGAMAATMH